jgi:signal transduction histidine kinase
VITEACLRWGFGDQVGPARVVVTEPVSNAVRHAATTMTLRVSRRGRWLLLAVEDGGPGLPVRPAMPAMPTKGQAVA